MGDICHAQVSTSRTGLGQGAPTSLGPGDGSAAAAGPGGLSDGERPVPGKKGRAAATHVLVAHRGRRATVRGCRSPEAVRERGVRTEHGSAFTARALLPRASAADLRGHGGGDEAEPWSARWEHRRLPADDLQPAQLNAEDRVAGRRAAACERYLHAVRARQGQPGPAPSAHHHRRRCVPRPVGPRRAVASFAVQVGKSSSPRHRSPSEDANRYRSSVVVLPAPAQLQNATTAPR